MSTTLVLARPRVRQGVVKSGGDPSRFSDFDIDFAIRTFGNDFVNRTRCTRTISNLDLLLNNPAVDFSGLTGFVPDLLYEYGALVVSSDWATATLSAGAVASIAVNYSAIYATTPTITFTGGDGSGAAATAHLTLGRITSITVDSAGSGYTSAPTVLINGVANNYSASDVACGVNITGLGDIREMQRCTRTGTPTDLGFSSMTVAQVYPTPKADGALNVCWTPTFTDFVPGTQGNYSGSTNYYLGDVVLSSSLVYTCIQSGINKTPASNTDYWTATGGTTLTAPGSVTLNIPDYLIDAVLFWGAGAGLMAPAEDIARGQGAMEAYESHVRNSMGRGGLGSKGSSRDSLRSRRD